MVILREHSSGVHEEEHKLIQAAIDEKKQRGQSNSGTSEIEAGMDQQTFNSYVFFDESLGFPVECPSKQFDLSALRGIPQELSTAIAFSGTSGQPNKLNY